MIILQKQCALSTHASNKTTINFRQIYIMKTMRNKQINRHTEHTTSNSTLSCMYVKSFKKYSPLAFHTLEGIRDDWKLY